MTAATGVLAATDPLGHVLDKTIIPLGGTAFTMNTLSLFVAAALFVWTMTVAAKAIALGPESDGAERYITKGRFAQIIEVIVVFLRDNIIAPQLGKQTNRFLPFILTLFFFIWYCNLFGLIPLIDIQYLATALITGEETKFIGGTPTGRVAVTGALALIAFFVWQISGIIISGPKAWAMHFTGGAPWFMWPIMVPVEIVGAIVKPSALAIRLFANMTGGHVLLAVVVGFTGSAIAGLGIVGLPVSALAFMGGLAIFFLEMFVATLQAFIFTVLTTIFLAQMVHHHHDEEHTAEAYDREHAAVDDPATLVTA